jgi:hypothetical protein
MTMSTDLAGHDEMRQAVGDVLNDFSRRVRQAHSFDEIDAHRDELAELIVGLIAPAHADDVAVHSQRKGATRPAR